MTERKNMFPQVGMDMSHQPRVGVQMQGEPGAVSAIAAGELGGDAGGATHGGDTDPAEEGDGGGAGAIVAVAAVAAVAYFLYK